MGKIRRILGEIKRMNKLKNRGEDILLYLQPYMEECFQNSCQVLQKDIEKQGIEVWDQLKNAVHEVLQLSKEAQNGNQKGAIQYLVFSFLKSGVYMDKLMVFIECLDDGFYLEQQETAQIFEFSFLYKQYMEDISFLHKKVKEKFIRLKNYEIMEVRLEYAFFYSSLIYKMMKNLSDLLMQEIEKSKVNVTDRFKVLYGEYLETAAVVCSKE